MPHAGNISPWNAARQTLVIRGQVPNGLANDFEIANDGVDRLLVRLELLEI